jgi:hypothetical protein
VVLSDIIERRIEIMDRRISWLALLVILGACLPSNPTPTAAPASTPLKSPPTAEEPARTPVPTREDRWPEFLKHTPIPWTTPLPPYEATALDGTYVKNDPSEQMWWNCARCPDFRPAGGVWRLQLDRGIYRIYYTVTGWRSLGSFTVEGDRLVLFNDPHCSSEVGEYTWLLEDGRLKLAEVQDPCPSNLPMRANNLTRQDWLACPAPGAAGTPPPECEFEGP